MSLILYNLYGIRILSLFAVATHANSDHSDSTTSFTVHRSKKLLKAFSDLMINSRQYYYYQYVKNVTNIESALQYRQGEKSD